MITEKPFIDREEELEILGSRYESDRAEFLVLYGRRRVGKTELVKHFVKGKGSVYHLVSRETEKDQIREFKESLSRTYPEFSDLVEDWETLLTKLGEKEKPVLVIDEFQYLIETNGEILRRFQKVWDEVLKNSDIKLILTGSSVGMMETEVLGYRSPLYGRRTGQLRLKPFTLKDIKELFPSKTFTELIEIYSILGGIPYYLEQFDTDSSLEDNISNHILRKDSVLREEAVNLLREELRESKNYFSVLKAVSSGKTTFNRISNETGIKKSSLSKYLIRLQELHLIEKRDPVTASKGSKSGRYYLSDNYLDFWFRYIFPNQSFLEQKPELFYKDVIEPDLDIYISKKFEDICIEFIVQTTEIYPKVGRWWYGEDEIDIVALNENDGRILLAECKWSKKPVDMSLLKSLKEKASQVRWKDDHREEEYMLFSRSGFTADLKELDDEVTLYSLDRMESEFYG